MYIFTGNIFPAAFIYYNVEPRIVKTTVHGGGNQLALCKNPRAIHFSFHHNSTSLKRDVAYHERSWCVFSWKLIKSLRQLGNHQALRPVTVSDYHPQGTLYLILPPQAFLWSENPTIISWDIAKKVKIVLNKVRAIPSWGPEGRHYNRLWLICNGLNHPMLFHTRRSVLLFYE